MTPARRTVRWSALPFLACVAVLATFHYGGAVIGMRLLGVALVVYAGAVLWYDGDAPGSPTNRRARRMAVVALCFILGGMGVAMLVRPVFMLQLMGGPG